MRASGGGGKVFETNRLILGCGLLRPVPQPSLIYVQAPSLKPGGRALSDREPRRVTRLFRLQGYPCIGCMRSYNGAVTGRHSHVLRSSVDAYR